MPAVSVCDPASIALRNSLESSQHKMSDDLSTSLVGNASQILQSEIQYEEVDNFKSTILEPLQAKYIKLSLPTTDNIHTNNYKDESNYMKKSEPKMKARPSLPEPTVTLYPPSQIVLGWKGNQHPVGAGMYNVGNTCYLNSTLQALFHVPALVNWLLSDSHHMSKCEQSDGGGECLTCAVAKTLQSSHLKSGCAIKPCYIYNKLKLICRTMVPGQQEDAHEFLRYLLEGMEKAYLTRSKANKLDSYSKETTPINQIFGGYIRTEVKCLQCQHVSTTFQHFQDLLLDIRKASTVDEALSSYFSREQLDNNDYKCEACKRRVPATKQFSLERAPKVLCIQLKRFSVLGGKISRHIGFKQTVDMGPYLWREPGEAPRQLTYKLMSMITHMGPSPNCGHYTAVAQVSSGQYYSFDDSFVRPISLNNVLTTNAYIMIFEMEQPAQTPKQNPQTIKLNGLSVTKNLSSSPATLLNKPLIPKASTSGIFPLNGVINGSGNNKNNVDSTKVNTPSKEPKEIQFPVQKTTSNFIGPQLPPKLLLDKSQTKLVVGHHKHEKMNGTSLVPYDDGSSEDEDCSVLETTGRHSSSNSLPSKSNSNSMPTSNSEIHKTSSIKDSPAKSIMTSDLQKTPTKLNGNGSSNGSLLQHQSSILLSTKPLQNNSNGNNVISSVKQNGKSESHNKVENNKEKWNHVRTKLKQEDKVVTKASSSSMNWEVVSKDVPSPTSAATPNGWSVTDTKEDNSKSSNHPNNTTPSVAEMRNFNGTNRSDTSSFLGKMSYRGYGSGSVTNWNGNKAHLDREVDNERREQRKRHYNLDDEEMDRGRMKKIKNRHLNNGRPNLYLDRQYNTEYWNCGGYYRGHPSKSFSKCFHSHRSRNSRSRKQNHSRW